MDLIISTLSYLIVYNLNNNKWYTVHKNDGPYYGIAQYKKNIIVGKRNGNNLINSYATFLVYDYKFNLIEELNPTLPIRDLHGIMVLNDNLWVTSTFDNIIGIYNFISKKWQCWKPSKKKNDIKEINAKLISNILKNKTKGDKHYNTIGFNNGYLNLVAHNWGKSEIFFYKLNNLEFFKKIYLGQKSHNIWYNNNEIFTLSSDTGEIISSENFKLTITEYPRGFAKGNDRIYVGVSTKNSLPGKKRDRYNSSFYVVSYNHDFKDQKNYFFKNLGDITDIFFSKNLEYKKSRI
ncbi:MAG: hypothetical protein CFH15_00656 [Alphaproteobacteria bacterium MarineAlpha5_Bin5]|nr:MAG: hypothetical protein CFH15_00656 [Alphaproteobacteria bacterium MarineAlpha5_Bin5]PPR52526.1 MAG: hypothetical protein CFH14_00282 [Alphaproteobacteria bacterium MarineAlpha5_Bin4]